MMQTRKKKTLITFIPLIPALITLLPELEGTAGTLPVSTLLRPPAFPSKIPNKQLEALYLDLRIFWDQSFRRCLECCDSLIFCLGFMQNAGELMGWNPHFRFHISVATFCHLCLVQSQVFLPKKAYDWLLVPFSGPLIVCAQDWIRLTFNGVCTMPILPPGCIDEATVFFTELHPNHVNPAMIFWVCSLQKLRHKGSVL